MTVIKIKVVLQKTCISFVKTVVVFRVTHNVSTNMRDDLKK